jgi:hypothetical protein
MVILDDVVRDTVQNFINDSALFTALDVSNKVKEIVPFAKHRDVRDLVRASFSSEIEPQGYAKTPIQVVLGDGSTVEALLYHSLADSWDLDAKYDSQKRNQSVFKPAAKSVSQVSNPVPVVVSPAPAVAAPIPTFTVVPTDPSARAAWENLFKSQPSLFPRK